MQTLVKRPIAFLLLVTLLIPVLAACGNQGATTGGQATTAPAATSAAGATTAPAATSGSAMGSTDAAQLKGSGASFPDPIYQRWIKDYKEVAPNVQIDYQSVGSGQGRKDFFGSLTDFGGTDKFASDDELTKAGSAVLHIPTVLGAVVTTYNLPGVDKLQFSGDTLAKIYLGEITKWNDPAIAADNSGVTLPDKNITVVYRADASGTTSIFTNYLSSVSPDWKSKVGGGDSVQWPVGIGAQKNPGVTQSVKQTEGAIGYVELVYALANKLPAPAIKNAAGAYTAPTLESVSAAAEGFLAQMPDDLRLNIVNPPTGDKAYPISGFTWILVRQDMQDEAKAKALVNFLDWALTKGGEQAKALGYAPLPDSVREKALAKLQTVTVNGQPVMAATK